MPPQQGVPATDDDGGFCRCSPASFLLPTLVADSVGLAPQTEEAPVSHDLQYYLRPHSKWFPYAQSSSKILDFITYKLKSMSGVTLKLSELNLTLQRISDVGYSLKMIKTSSANQFCQWLEDC